MHRGGGGPFGIAAITGGNIDGAVIGATTPAAITGTTITSTGVFLAADGSASNCSYGFTNNVNLGLFRSGGNTFDAVAASVAVMRFTSVGVHAIATAGGGFARWGTLVETLSLSTGGTTTDTTANLLPADSYVQSVTARVLITVATATDWKLGDATTAGRFTAAQSGAQLTAGATVVGLVHCDVTGAGGPRQTAAAKVRVTTTGTPSAGQLRITSHFLTFSAPAS